MLGKVPVEAIDRQVQCAVRVPADVKVLFVVRPVARLGWRLVPGDPLRLVEPEAPQVGSGEIVELGELARANASVESLGDRMDRLGH